MSGHEIGLALDEIVNHTHNLLHEHQAETIVTYTEGILRVVTERALNHVTKQTTFFVNDTPYTDHMRAVLALMTT